MISYPNYDTYDILNDIILFGHHTQNYDIMYDIIIIVQESQAYDIIYDIIGRGIGFCMILAMLSYMILS
jgi:hypothetical protein